MDLTSHTKAHTSVAKSHFKMIFMKYQWCHCYLFMELSTKALSLGMVMLCV